MFKILMVGLGGFTGSICRFLVYEASMALFKGSWLPIGTLTVNIVGCLLIGFLAGLSELKGIFSPEIRALVFIGFLGGFTTFSTFGYEVFAMIREGQITAPLINVGIHLVAGLTAVWIGFTLSKLL